MNERRNVTRVAALALLTACSPLFDSHSEQATEAEALALIARLDEAVRSRDIQSAAVIFWSRAEYRLRDYDPNTPDHYGAEAWLRLEIDFATQLGWNRSRDIERVMSRDGIVAVTTRVWTWALEPGGRRKIQSREAFVVYKLAGVSRIRSVVYEVVTNQVVPEAS